MSFGDDIVELVEGSENALHAAADWWCRVPLGRVVKVLNGYPFDSKLFDDTKGHRLIRIRDVTSGDTATYFNGPAPDDYWVRAGDIVVGMDGDFNLRTWDAEPGLLNQRVCKLTPDESIIDKRFLALALPGYLKLINDNTPSVTVKHLSSRTLQEVPIPLPPLAEQRRIVARIEALFARTRRARAELERVAPLARHHRDQTLASLMDDAWPQRAVADVAATTFDGPFGSNLKSSDYVPAGTRVVRLENIGHLSFIGEKETFIDIEKAAGLARHRLVSGDVLFSSFVDKEVRVCLLPENLPTEAINKADCFCVRVDRHQCDPRFLAYRLAAPTTYEDMREAVHGATRPRIGLGDLKRYRVGVPSLEQQRSVVAKVEKAHAAAERAEHEATRALALLDRLEQAILAKAFRGELVPQDPSEEPASALLARLQPSATAPRRGRPRQAARA